MRDLIALVDGSVYSQSVCDHAAWIAHRLGAPVTIAHILGHRQGVKSNLSGNIGLGARTALLEELAELDAATARLSQKRGRAILEDAKARIEAAGVAQVETRLRNGDLVETVLEMEATADLIVVGKRGEAADFAKLHLGSNVERVIRASQRPVLVCSRAFKPVERIMIAFDGGASVQKAVDHIARSPMFDGLPCQILTVGAVTGDLHRKLEGAATLLRGGGFDVTTSLLPGHPEEVIAEQIRAGAADLLIMGAHTHARLRALILGSATTEMIRSCQVPVMLFK